MEAVKEHRDLGLKVAVSNNHNMQWAVQASKPAEVEREHPRDRAKLWHQVL